jgi:hypothetical protein
MKCRVRGELRPECEGPVRRKHASVISIRDTLPRWLSERWPLYIKRSSPVSRDITDDEENLKQTYQGLQSFF